MSLKSSFRAMLSAVSTTGQVRLLINASTQLDAGSGRVVWALRLSKVTQGMRIRVPMTSAGRYKRQALRFGWKSEETAAGDRATSVLWWALHTRRPRARKTCCSVIRSLSPTTSTLLVTLGKARATLRSFRNCGLHVEESAQRSSTRRCRSACRRC